MLPLGLWMVMESRTFVEDRGVDGTKVGSASGVGDGDVRCNDVRGGRTYRVNVRSRIC
jgi:hypothetical protein